MKPTPISFYSLKQEIDELSLDPAAKLGLRLAFSAIGLQFIVIALFWYRLPPEVPLLYSRAYGKAQLVNGFWLWFLPLLTLALELISIRLAAKARVDHQLWSQILAWLGAIIAAMGLTTLIKIVNLMV